MGLTGKFTPIGHFNEVEFQGAKLRKASLGNMTRLAQEFEGLTIGSNIASNKSKLKLVIAASNAFIIDGFSFRSALMISLLAPHIATSLLIVETGT